MRHAVGYHSDNPGYRNYFCTEEDNAVWSYLVDQGFAAGSERLGSYGFWLTEKGEDLIGLPEQIRHKEGIDRRARQNFEEFCEDRQIEY